MLTRITASSVDLVFATNLSSSSATSQWQYLMATCKGVSPALDCHVGSAPSAKSAVTIFCCPYLAAICKAVSPFYNDMKSNFIELYFALNAIGGAGVGGAGIGGDLHTSSRKSEGFHSVEMWTPFHFMLHIHVRNINIVFTNYDIKLPRTSLVAFTSAPDFTNISAHFSPSFILAAMWSGVSCACKIIFKK